MADGCVQDLLDELSSVEESLRNISCTMLSFAVPHVCLVFCFRAMIPTMSKHGPRWQNDDVAKEYMLAGRCFGSD